MWWQQDEAPCHTSNVTMRYLRGQVPDKVTNLGKKRKGDAEGHGII